jgi:hypothetical protein
VTLEIKWDINSFKILSVKINGTDMKAIVNSVKTERPEAFQDWIFSITWVYSNGKISIETGNTTKSRKINTKGIEKYEGQRITLKIKWTINDFKVVSPIALSE